jgi:hypothetical protein
MPPQGVAERLRACAFVTWGSIRCPVPPSLASGEVLTLNFLGQHRAIQSEMAMPSDAWHDELTAELIHSDIFMFYVLSILRLRAPIFPTWTRSVHIATDGGALLPIH